MLADEDGFWSVEDLTPGTYAVCFEDALGRYVAECFDDQPFSSDGALATPVVVEEGDFPYISAQLARVAAEPVQVSGTVTDGAGDPVEGVSVVLWGDDLRRAVSVTSTAGDGTYGFEELDGHQDYVVCFEASGTGFRNECFDDEPYSAEPDDLPRNEVDEEGLRMDAVLSASIESRGSVTGRVTDEDGRPVEGYVYVLDAETGLADSYISLTAADGSYVVGGIEDADYHVCVDTNLYDLPEGQTGYAPECLDDVPNFTVSRGAGRAIDVAGDRHPATDFTLGAGAALVIKTVDAQGEPVSTYFSVGWDRVIEGAYVDTEETNGFLRDEPGVGKLSDLPAGSYYVCAGDGRWYIEDSEYEDACFVDAPAPPPFHWVTNGGTEAAQAAGATLVELAPGEEQVVVITLDAKPVAAPVTGEVTDSGGDPVPAVAVFVRRVGEGIPRAIVLTDALGRYSTEPLGPGEYTVCFQAQGTGKVSECHDNQPYRTSSAGLDPLQSEDEGIVADAVLADDPEPQLNSVVGSLRDETGASIVGFVDLWDGSDNQAKTAVSARNGVFFVSDVPDGSYRVCAQGLGSSTGDVGYGFECWDGVPSFGGPGIGAQPFDLSSGERVDGLDFELARGALVTIRAEAADGQPIEGADAFLTGLEFSGPTKVSSRRSTTNTDGEFMVGNLAPGRYYVCVEMTCDGTAGPVPRPVEQPVFTQEQAEQQGIRVLTLTPGDEVMVTITSPDPGTG